MRETLLKVALPLASVATEPPPLIVEPPGLVAIVRVTVSPTTGMLLASRTCTTIAGVIATPATAFEGCTLNVMVLGTLDVMLNAALVAVVNDPSAALSW